MSKNQDLVNSFIPGDFVVYPSHGVGKIIGTEKRKVEDLELELLVIRFEHERMSQEKGKGLIVPPRSETDNENLCDVSEHNMYQSQQVHAMPSPANIQVDSKDNPYLT